MRDNLRKVGRVINREAVAALRRKDGLSVSELARRVQCRPSTLNDIETGRRGASLSLTRKLAVALNVPLSAIEHSLHTDRGNPL